MRILLVAQDSVIFPNIAIGKLSHYFKSQGHDVVVKRLYTVLTYVEFSAENYLHQYNPIDGSGFDEVYISKIYEWVPKLDVINCDNVTYGGSGFFNDSNVEYAFLPEEIHHSDIDYGPWGENSVVDIKSGKKQLEFGFLTRGCFRNCPFCLSSKLTDCKIVLDQTVDNMIKRTNYIVLYDDNILAYKEANSLLQELIDKNVYVVHHRGIDLRLVNHENAKLMSQLKMGTEDFQAQFFVAFDRSVHKKQIARGLDILLQYVSPSRMRCGVFQGVNTSLKDSLERVQFLYDLKIKTFYALERGLLQGKSSEYLEAFQFLYRYSTLFRTNTLITQKNSFGFILGRTKIVDINPPISAESWAKETDYPNYKKILDYIYHGENYEN